MCYDTLENKLTLNRSVINMFSNNIVMVLTFIQAVSRKVMIEFIVKP